MGADQLYHYNKEKKNTNVKHEIYLNFQIIMTKILVQYELINYDKIQGILKNPISTMQWPRKDLRTPCTIRIHIHAQSHTNRTDRGRNRQYFILLYIDPFGFRPQIHNKR